AQAASLPVIASACEGPRAVIRDGETGVLVPPDDAPALASAIEGLMDDAGRAGSLARAGHADCAARHLLPAIADDYAGWVMGAGRG
ncbi:MAG: glycosyltransferase, partial [Zavarzinia sp.]|nr:glycosyltransferase [Zavarzinia sp.]